MYLVLNKGVFEELVSLLPCRLAMKLGGWLGLVKQTKDLSALYTTLCSLRNTHVQGRDIEREELGVW